MSFVKGERVRVTTLVEGDEDTDLKIGDTGTIVGEHNTLYEVSRLYNVLLDDISTVEKGENLNEEDGTYMFLETQIEAVDTADEEDKQCICNCLASALRATRGQWDVTGIHYNYKDETATVVYREGGRRVINVALDSGMAMIKDIIGALS